jgi:hypothetical protein
MNGFKQFVNCLSFSRLAGSSPLPYNNLENYGYTKNEIKPAGISPANLN